MLPPTPRAKSKKWFPNS